MTDGNSGIEGEGVGIILGDSVGIEVRVGEEVGVCVTVGVGLALRLIVNEREGLPANCVKGVGSLIATGIPKIETVTFAEFSYSVSNFKVTLELVDEIIVFCCFQFNHSILLGFAEPCGVTVMFSAISFP